MSEITDLTLNEYQDYASETFKYIPEMGMPIRVFTALGLNEEAGEVAGKIKKFYRDNIPVELSTEAIGLELGDTLWYLSQCARLWGYTLNDIALMNINKLKDRHERNVIHGSGDNR
jgi:NTP pyrophosphatase (non-canonical NTP hydrolase)